MIKTEKLTKLFATEEVQTKALNEVTLPVSYTHLTLPTICSV